MSIILIISSSKSRAGGLEPETACSADLITTVRGVGYGIKPPEKKSGKTRK